ncbi:helix-turn-helix domain-containing protein [Aerococcus viridans]
MNKDNISIYIGNKIKYYRKNNGWTQEELGKKLNTSKGRISNFERGYRTPNQDMLFEMAEIFDISIDDLFPKINGSRTKQEITSIYNKLNPTRQTKVYNFAERQLEEQKRDNVVDFPERHVVTGRGSAAGSALYVDDADVRHDVLPASMVPSGADELVEINGHSMEPLINNGEKIYIRYQPTVENGEIAIVRIENEGVTCKRVYVDGDTVTLKSENEEFSDMLFAPSEVTILGKVLLK